MAVGVAVATAFTAIVTAFTKGFIETLPNITDEELRLLPFSIKLMTLECGVRFLTDHLNGDVYFRISRPGLADEA